VSSNPLPNVFADHWQGEELAEVAKLVRQGKKIESELSVSGDFE